MAAFNLKNNWIWKVSASNIFAAIIPVSMVCKHSILTEKNAALYRVKWINQDIDKN